MKIGDRVICIDDRYSGVPKELRHNHVYTINIMTTIMNSSTKGIGFVGLKERGETTGQWFKDRFRVYKIDNWKGEFK